MDSALETMQTAAVKLLEEERFFQPVPVMHERLKNVQAEIRKQVNRLSGIAILVLTPVGKNNQPATPGPKLDVVLDVEVAENVLINTAANGTQLPCSLVAEQVAAHLHLAQWKPGKTFVFRDIKLVPNNSLVVYRVIFDTSTQLTKI